MPDKIFKRKGLVYKGDGAWWAVGWSMRTGNRMIYWFATWEAALKHALTEYDA